MNGAMDPPGPPCYVPPAWKLVNEGINFNILKIAISKCAINLSRAQKLLRNPDITCDDDCGKMEVELGLLRVWMEKKPRNLLQVSCSGVGLENDAMFQ